MTKRLEELIEYHEEDQPLDYTENEYEAFLEGLNLALDLIDSRGMFDVN